MNNPWKPVRHSIFNNDGLADIIHEVGYKVTPFLDQASLNQLQALYDETHQINDARGGMFYSVYSRDLAYRKKIHDRINDILQPILDTKFSNFRVMINSFVIKAPGPKSEFHLHADTTGLDESKYSALNVWIPLLDVDKDNGALALVPKSHKFFTPYRSISFPAPFDHIQSTVKKYLKVIPVKAGEALIFDNRLLHNSPPNTTNQTRVAVVCGLFPKEATMMTCHKENYVLEGKVELIEHNDDFLLTHPKFLIDCQDRPHLGKSLGFVDDNYPKISPEEFEELCKAHHVNESNEISIESTDCNLIGEPIHEEEEEENSIPSHNENNIPTQKSTVSKLFDKLRQFVK